MPSNHNPHGTSVARELCAKFPNTASRALARIAYNENKPVFKDFNAAYCAIRHQRGAIGLKRRESVIKNGAEFVRPHGKGGNPFIKIPEPKCHFDEPWKAVQFNGAARTLVFGDVHIPYHDPVVKVILRHAKDQKINRVLLNGDVADFYACSKWQTDPRKRDFAGEIEMVRQFLEVVRDCFPKAEIVYKQGNHEERYERYLSVKAPELLGVEDFQFEKLLRLDDLGITSVGDKRPVRLGDLNVIHGHEYRFQISNPVNPARGLFLKAKTYALCNHFHQASFHSETNLEGKSVATWSLGCTCDLHPEYAPLNNWGHSFAIVETDKDNKFQVEARSIKGGKIY